MTHADVPSALPDDTLPLGALPLDTRPAVQDDFDPWQDEHLSISEHERLETGLPDLSQSPEKSEASPLDSLPASLFEEFEVSVNQKGKIKLKTRNTPSADQARVLEFIEHDTKNGLIKSTAGSGKTTLLEMIGELLNTLRRVDADHPAGVMSFNKKIVDELGKRMPANFDTLTFNALGQRIIKDAFGETTFDPDKYERLIELALSQRSYRGKQMGAMRKLLRESLALSVSNIVDMRLREMWLLTMQEFEVPVEAAEDDLYGLTREVIKEGMRELRQERICSFYDQTYAPYAFNWKLTSTFSTLLIDEGQDLNAGQTNLLLAATHPGSRTVVVGDAAQAIFNFRGSSRRSLDELGQMLGAKEMSLSVSFRCPTRHIELARPYTDAIEAAPGARTGTLDAITNQDFVQMVKPGDLVLCRTNTPLFSICYALLRHGKAAYIEGRDVSKGLNRLARDAAAWNGQQVSLVAAEDHTPIDATFKVRLLAYHKHLRAQAEARADNGQRAARLIILDDRLDALLLIIDEAAATSLGELCTAVSELFKGNKKSVILSSVHKAKGLENTTVFLLEPQLIPHPAATTAADLEGESAVQFVAYTRSKRDLYLVFGDDTDPDLIDTYLPPHLRGRETPKQT